MLATIVDTLQDLGAPAVFGAIIGALIAHLTAKSRGREDHERAIELQSRQHQHALALQLSQDERRAAQRALEASRALRTRVNGPGPLAYGDLHNEWQDSILPPSKLVRSEDLNARVVALGTMIFLAFLAPEPGAPYWISTAALDVEAWLEAWLVGGEPRAPSVPAHGEILSLSRDGGNVSFEGLVSWLEKQGSR